MRRASLGAGIVAILVSLSPPVHELADELFSAHMVQHLLLMLVAAPCIAYARPLGRQVPILLTVTVNAVVMWSWHAPALYETAIASPLLHIVEHVTFLGAAWLLWSYVLHGDHRAQRVLALFATALQSSALGAILALASVPLFDVHIAGARAHGLTPLQDQQLAGTIMWVPAGLVYLFAMVALLFTWFRSLEQAAPVSDR